MDSVQVTFAQRVDTFFAGNAIWLVPLVLVLLKFLLKLYLGEKVGPLRLWQNFLQSPVDVGFLALSFVATIIISTSGHANSSFAVAVVFLLLLVVAILIWKLSPNTAGSRDILISSALVIVNYTIAVLMLVYSVSLLLRK